LKFRYQITSQHGVITHKRVLFAKILFVCHFVRFSFLVMLEAPEGSAARASFCVAERQTATQLHLLSVFTLRKERAVQQLNVSATAEKRIRINAGKAMFKVLSAVLLKVQIFWI